MKATMASHRSFSEYTIPCLRPISGIAARPSAAVKIGKRWAEYQGANNWDGLLDPLDNTLRSEILRYGEFVRAAYSSFDPDPSSPTYSSCRFPKHSLLPSSGLPSTGYRVTRNLHATSTARLPWAAYPAAASSPSSWIGYVAVSDDEDEIARLGRRDIVVAFRGTFTCHEWLENLRASLTRLPCAAGAHPDPMVERGFWSLFTTPGPATSQSLRDEVRDEVRRLLGSFAGTGTPVSLTLTGHSLGAALAVLAAYDITATVPGAPMVTVVSFGGPRVGNGSFRRKLEEQGSKVLRIVNTEDIVTRMPGFVVDREAAEEERAAGGGGGGGMIPNWLLSRSGWVYADIGKELRVSGRRSANVAACHDLNVYLDLVDGLAATCPFRSKPSAGTWWPFGAEATTPGQ